MSKATVTVTDVQRGVSRTLTADEAGEYNAPNLTPGSYKVRAEAPGFKAIERQNILLEVAQEIRVDLSLQPGETSQTITVTEQLPLVETTTAALGGTISNQTINDLPLNGRNYVNLLTLRPGVQVYPGGGTHTRSANGTRTEDIGYLLDGVRGDEPFTGQSVLNAPIAAGDSSSSLPIDAIQEFKTEQNPKAEFGWKPGSIVNAGMKSGTNGLHGTAFAFGRETSLDARNFFDEPSQPSCLAPCPKTPIALKQFGASLGGPIKKDKLFFFGNYEGQRYTVGSTFTINTPITCGGGTPGCGLPAPSTSLSLVDACNAVAAISGGGFSPVGTPGKVTWLSAQIAGISIDPVTGCKVAAPNYTPGTGESLFPANNGSGLSTLLGLVSNNQQDNGVGKLDYHINDRHSLTGMYFRGQGGGIWNDSATEPGIAGASSSPFMSNLHGIAQLVSAGWTWTPNSSWVNELRFGYAYYHQIYLSVDANVNPLAYGINTGVTAPGFFGFPSIRISGGPNVRLGGNWPKISGPDGSMQFSDHVSVLRGKHAFKFGGEITSNKVMPFITTNGKGSFRFSNLSNYLRGVERNTGTVSQILLGNPLRHISNQQYAGFLQDDWRLSPRLTVNLGLRYELTTVIKDRDNQLGNFDPNSPTGLVQVGSGLSSIFNGDHNNFSPRVGFAWDVQGNGKTVVRAGGNVMYAHLPIDVFTNIANLLGLNLVPTGAAYVVNGVTTQGTGNMGVIQINVFGGAGTPFTQAWQNQTSTCVSTGSAACGAIFPTQLQCGTGLGTDPAPCNTEAVDRNLRTPYISTWSLDVQRAFTNNLSLDVAYVGTHGTKLLGFQDINQPPIGTGNANFGTCALSGTQKTVANCEQIARPFFGKFPYLAQIDQLSNLDHSNYNALQVTLTQRTTHGLSFIAGYTFAHSLDEASSNWNANTLPPDSSRPGLQYGNSDFDIRHRGTFSLNYAIPGRSGFGQMLKGWELNSIVTLQTGQPWGGRDTTNDFTGNGQVGELASFGQPWNFFGNPSDFTSGPNPIPFFNSSAAICQGHPNSDPSLGCFAQGSSVLVAPAPGTLGNAGRNIFRDSGFRVWDMSVAKRFQFKERLSAQFRTEFFNILNHPIFTNPGGPGGAGFNDPSGSNFGCGCFTPDTAATNPVLGSGGARSIQLGLKLIW